jgi:pimeloyl-ACP methyl ester carboxylesterase
MVVGLRDDVAFVVLMGATGVVGATIVTSQTEAIQRAGGADEAEIAVARAVNRAVTDLAMSSAPGADLSADLDSVLAPIIQTLPESDRDEAAAVILQAVRNTLPRLQSQWMRFFLSYDPRPALRNIACPVLAITGSKDVQVLPDLNLPEIETALREGGNQDYEVIELEGLNHMFQSSATGSVGEYASIAETFNPVALETIHSWIARRTTISAAATGRP